MNTLKPLLSVISLAVITACGGGGSSDNQTANGGMGGTGISQGPVTGFGSVYVNGVRYDTSSAAFSREGANSATQNDFALGEYVTVSGSINADGVTGTASQVYFEDLVEGPVSSVNPTSDTLIVLGQTVTTDQLTITLGFRLVSDLQVGNVVEVSGSRDASGNILATAIRLKGASPDDSPEAEVNGTVSNLNEVNQTFVLSGGSILVDYSTATLTDFGSASLQNGQTVEVKSRSAFNGVTLLASTVELESSSSSSFSANTEVELEGLVTRFAGLTDFAVNGIAVTTTTATEFESGSAGISLNTRVKVEGTVNAGGVLVAREVDLREAGSSAELKATIDAIDLNASTVTVLGNVLKVDSYTILWEESGSDDLTFTLSRLSAGDYAEVRYNRLSDGTLLASRIKIENDTSGGSGGDEDTELEGDVTAIDSAAQTFVMEGVTVKVVPGTELKDASSAAEFFASLQVGTQLEVKGILTGSSLLEATEIEIDD